MIAMYGVDQPGVNNVSLEPSAEYEASKALRNGLLIGGAVLLGLIAVAGIALLVLRTIRQAQLKRRHKLINRGGR